MVSRCFQQHFHQIDVSRSHPLPVKCWISTGYKHADAIGLSKYSKSVGKPTETLNWSLKMGPRPKGPKAQVMGQNDLGHTVTWIFFGA